MRYFARIVMYFPLEAFDVVFHDSLREVAELSRLAVKASMSKNNKEYFRLVWKKGKLTRHLSDRLFLEQSFCQAVADKIVESSFEPDTRPNLFYLRLIISGNDESLVIRGLAEECLALAVAQGGEGYADEGLVTKEEVCWEMEGVATGYSFDSETPEKGWHISDYNSLAARTADNN